MPYTRIPAFMGAAATTAMCALFASSASAQTASGAPVQVLNFQYAPSVPVEAEAGEPNDPVVIVTFKNVSQQLERRVTFGVYGSNGHQIGTVSRHGHFAPGVSVTRNFGAVRVKDKDGVPIKATPIRIQFADGSTWVAK